MASYYYSSATLYFCSLLLLLLGYMLALKGKGCPCSAPSQFSRPFIGK